MKKLSRTKILTHYKNFFDLNELGVGEGDMIHIDWAESLLEDVANGLDTSHKTALHKHDVNNSVCPKCASEDVIWTCYCNHCHEAM